jgi:hypothetical protein
MFFKRGKKIFCYSLLIPATVIPSTSLYIFPELLDNPSEFISASSRLLRVYKSGAKMAINYYLNGINSESHKYSAQTLK